jgi:hypothetical protein
VTKPLAASTITERGRSGVVYTTEVMPRHWDDPAIAATAHVFQEFVPGVDVRLTMVGKSVFAAAIHPRHADEHIIDIRAHHDDVDYSMVTVPDGVRHACQAMLDRLGFSFMTCVLRSQPRSLTSLRKASRKAWTSERGCP